MCEIVSTSSSLSIKDTHCVDGIMAYSDSGLPGILFSLLDQEEDSQVGLHNFTMGEGTPDRTSTREKDSQAGRHLRRRTAI